MKILFYSLIGVIVLVVVIVVGGGYWLANTHVDFSNPQTVAGFKQTFSSNCVATYKQRLEKAKIEVSDERLSKAQSACDCARDPIIDALAKHPSMTVSELAELMGKDPDIANITKSCAAQFGIENPT